MGEQRVSMTQTARILTIKKSVEYANEGKSYEEILGLILTDREIKVRNIGEAKGNGKVAFSKLDLDSEVEVESDGEKVTLKCNKAVKGGKKTFDISYANEMVARIKAGDCEYDKQTGRPYVWDEGKQFFPIVYAIFAQHELGLTESDISELKARIQVPAE